MAAPGDVLAEITGTFDASQVYVGPWLDAAGVSQVGIEVFYGGGFLPGFRLEGSPDRVTVTSDEPVLAHDGAEVAVPARYLRLRASGGQPSGDVEATLRVAS